MIDLTVDNGRVLVWNVDDVIKIRQEYRIIGQLLGTLASFSYQDKQRGLPLALLNEEVNILVEKGFARLVQVPAISQKPSEEAVERFKEYREQSYQKQVTIFKEGREKQIRSMLDRIVEGKQNKRRQRMRSNISVMQSTGEAKKIKTEDEKEDVKSKESYLDPAVLLKEELAKIEPIPRENSQVKSFSVSPFLEAVLMADPPWNYPSNEEEYLHYRVFKDFWERGFYVTQAYNFGGDYLVYPGDPMLFHAHYVVRCVNYDGPIRATDLIAFARLSVSVRKRAVLASLRKYDDGSEEVVYQTFSWSTTFEHGTSRLPTKITLQQSITDT